MKKRYIVAFLVSFLLIGSVFIYTEKDDKKASTYLQPKPKVAVKEITPGADTPEVEKSETENKKKSKLVSSAPAYATPFINAPLKRADIPFQKETVKASAGKKIVSANHTQLIIPANAFLDEHGQVVKGNVELQFREFHDHADIFLSGIPMTYDNHTFESAGMIELNASANGKPVFVNPENKITIEIPSANTDSDFNLYYLDTLEKKWKLKEEELATSSLASSGETIDVLEYEVISDGSLQWKSSYSYNSIDTVTINGKNVNMVEPKIISGNYYDLNLSLSQYPELSMYDGLKWQTIDSKKKRAVAGIFPKQLKMNGNPTFKIVNRIGESDSFKIRMTGASSSVDIIFLPVFEVDDYYYAKTLYNKLRLTGDPQQVQAMIQDLDRQRADNLVKRSFRIDGFGIWNCDRIYLIPNAKTITVKLEREDTKQPVAGNFYLANKKVNSVITYYAGGENNLTYNGESENLIWTILDNGKIAYYKFKDIEGYYKGKIEKIQLRVVDEPIDSKEDVKRILNSI